MNEKGSNRKKWWVASIALVVAPFAVLAVMSAAASRPTNLGVDDGQLAACPESPNCVNSQATGAQHRIEPLRYNDDSVSARQRLLAVLGNETRCEVVAAEDDYIHAEFTSPIFRFVDDVEFYFDASASQIHVRSASRVGKSDLGANRARIERIRATFESPRKAKKLQEDA